MTREKIGETVTGLKTGDVITINDWKTPMRVCGVSDGYVLAHAGDEYTIIMRQPTHLQYKGIPSGAFVCGPDWWTFGWGIDPYRFDDPAWVEKYLASLESGETEVSMRNRAEIRKITVA